ncbi:MAG: hypothetical protein N3D84_00925 [Candidatus Woesearchaeota archaeon]|nr:hypothetical protein [Candidatus Woesearchaeota archaeon]
MAEFILKLHQDVSAKEAEIDTLFLRKYIAYARKNIIPELTEGAMEEIKSYYITMRASGSTEESAVRTIPLTARQLEALVRLAEANAKLRLSKKVTRNDAKKAIELLDYCLKQVGLDRETGKIDIDRIATGITATERSTIVIVKEIIADLERVEKPVMIEHIIKEADKRKISADKVDDAIERLKRAGDLFEPKRGFVQRT